MSGNAKMRKITLNNMLTARVYGTISVIAFYFLLSGCATAPDAVHTVPEEPMILEEEPVLGDVIVPEPREFTHPPVKAGTAQEPQTVQVEDQLYPCGKLRRRMSDLEDYLQGAGEDEIKQHLDEIIILNETAKQNNCRTILRIFNEPQEKATPEKLRRTTTGAAVSGITFWSCLKKAKSYRQPHWFIATTLACATAAWITN